jgi:hypothetical protein
MRTSNDEPDPALAAEATAAMDRFVELGPGLRHAANAALPAPDQAGSASSGRRLRLGWIDTPQNGACTMIWATPLVGDSLE